MTEGDTERLDQQTRAWIEEILDRLEMVEWDRFVVGNDPEAGQYINVYGWIDRESDEYKDFVLVRFFPDTANDLVSYTTSSDRYTETIYERIFSEEPEDHNGCRRVEHTFDVSNAVELTEQTTLVQTDGDETAATSSTEGE